VATERLDRARVVKTAVDLLDEVGLDGLSLRRLAKELGVQAPALYWHFKNKDELLEEMVVAISQEDPVPPPQPGQAWDAWIAMRARMMRASLNRHRDGAMLAASTRPAPSQFADLEAELELMVAAGFSPAEALRTFIAIGNYVAGFTLDEQADRTRGDIQPTEDDWNEMMDQLAPFPLMRAAMIEVGDPQSDAAFEAGLSYIIAGIATKLQGA